MRILVWTAHFAPHLGGVENFTRSLFSRLAKKGHHVTLLTCNTNQACQTECLDGIQVYRYTSLNLLGSRYPIPLTLSRFSKALRESYDVCVTNTRFFPTTWLGCRFALRKGIPYLHIEHGSGWEVSESWVVNQIVRIVDHSIGAYVLSRASAVGAVSTDVQKYCRSLGRAHSLLIPNAIDTGKFSWDREAARDDLGITHKPLAILFAGRLVENKGILCFLQAAARLTAEGLIFIVAGDGKLRSTVEIASRKCPSILYLGPLAHDVMPKAYAAADIVCHPSFCREGLPTVLLEAGASGRPLIAADAPGVRDIIPDERYGVIIPPRDPDALAGAIRKLVANNDLRIRLAAAVQDRVRKFFDLEVVATNVERLLQSLVANSGASDYSPPGVAEKMC